MLADLAAQGLVAAHQGDFDPDLVAFLESPHHIAVGIARPRQHPQRALLFACACVAVRNTSKGSQKRRR